MKVRKIKAIALAFTMTVFIGASWAQSSSYLAQKLMVESDLRKRITAALEKVIDNRKYVVDVSIDLELSFAVEEQTTFSPQGSAPSRADRTAGLLEKSSAMRRGIDARSSGVGLPIPGFDFDAEETPTYDEPTIGTDAVSESPASAGRDNILSRTRTEKHPAIANIRNMEISIILQEGAAPELIENIRQVIMVASRFNRARGDVLSIMTASFKERRDEKSAEQILLKSIADKLESLEAQRESLGQVDWKQELENYKQEESVRRQEDRLYFQSKLAEFESTSRDQAFNREKEDILRQDSARIQALNEEIQNLKTFLGTGTPSDSAAFQAQSKVREKLQEKAGLDTQIAEKLAMLESVQADIDQQYRDGSGDTTLVVIVSILAALVIVLIVVLAFVMMNKSKPQIAAPPPWMYPPRRKKKSKPGNGPITESKPAPAPLPPSPPPAPEPEDIAVLQSEVNDMKQAVISMSVGQPKAATRIVKEWIQEEAPPEPEPTPALAPAPEAEEDSGKKKKKKKKK